MPPRNLLPNFARYAIGIQYYGPRYSGWSKSACEKANEISLFSVVGKAIGKFVGPTNFTNLYVSSRTDRGVHAIRNVMQVDLSHRERTLNLPENSAPYTPETVKCGLNHFLRRESITITDVELKDAQYDSRGLATGRTYIYRIQCCRNGDIAGRFVQNGIPYGEFGHYRSLYQGDRNWILEGSLDVPAMRQAAALLLGERNHSSFQSSGCDSRSPFRDITVLDISHHSATELASRLSQSYKNDGSSANSLDFLNDVLLMDSELDIITIKIKANSFLRRMVRNIVAMLVEVGQGRMSVQQVQPVMEAGRRLILKPAPPQGLFLSEVHYDPLELTSFARVARIHQRASEEKARQSTDGHEGEDEDEDEDE